MKRFIIMLTISILFTFDLLSQTQFNNEMSLNDNTKSHKNYSLSTTYLSLANFGEEKTNTHHYELHIGYEVSDKDKVGIKIATWKLFAPLGMPMQEQLEFDEQNFYPGRLRESGIGITYQRKVWKELFVAAEILPQLKTYYNEDNKKVGDGFKLYTSYHIGYHIPLFRDKFFIDPQIHCQYWPIDTNVPKSFKDNDDEWNNYFLFEPNLYLGLNFKY